MSTKTAATRFVILPSRGTVAKANASTAVKSFLQKLSPKPAAYTLKEQKLKGAKMKVLDALSEDGAKLVEMTTETMAAMRSAQPGIRIVPVAYYQKAAVAKAAVLQRVKKAANLPGTSFRILAGDTGEGVEGCDVRAFTDFENRIGDMGITNKQGKVTLRIPAGETVQRLYLYPRKGYWGVLKKNIVLQAGQTAALPPLELTFEDSLRFLYKNVKFPKPKKKIKIGVLDTGSGPHKDLVIEGGLNCVLGEEPDDFLDNSDGHGTHVAGIIAARGNPPEGVQGLAPDATLRSYRIFGKDADSAENFAIAKAIRAAVEDGCDILNMSISGGPVEPVVNEAISDAFDKGTICFVAAGNDGRQPVGFPASFSLSEAVSAMGRKGKFPAGTIHTETVEKPFSASDPENFIASFSNVGPEVDFTAPGVAVISTVPDGYLAMDGTSMSCPAAVGAAARFLQGHDNLLDMPRNQDRSVAMVTFLAKKARLLKFGVVFEGNGMIV